MYFKNTRCELKRYFYTLGCFRCFSIWFCWCVEVGQKKGLITILTRILLFKDIWSEIENKFTINNPDTEDSYCLNIVETNRFNTTWQNICPNFILTNIEIILQSKQVIFFLKLCYCYIKNAHIKYPNRFVITNFYRTSIHQMPKRQNKNC